MQAHRVGALAACELSQEGVARHLFLDLSRLNTQIRSAKCPSGFDPGLPVSYRPLATDDAPRLANPTRKPRKGYRLRLGDPSGPPASAGLRPRGAKKVARKGWPHTPTPSSQVPGSGSP